MYKKLFIPIYLGFILFSLLSFFIGPVGINNSKKLTYFQSSMKQYVKELENRGVALEDEINLLKHSPDRMKVAVRPLGLFEPGEKVIKVINYEVTDSLYKVDRHYRIPDFKKTNSNLVLVSGVFAVILFVGILLIGVLRDTIKGK